MAYLTTPPKLQFFTAAGIPLVGGKLYSYSAGTTTPLATYTDQSGGTPNTNPVILNSRGEASVWLGNDNYKLKLTDANDVEIWTVDNIEGDPTLATLAGPNGATLIGYTTPSGSITTVAAALDGIPTELTTNVTYYVRTDGNDNNNGLTNTPSGAFKTIQRGVNAAYANNTNGYIITVKVGDGTYSEAVQVINSLIGNGFLYITGNTVTPGSCIVNGGGGNAFTFSGGASAILRGFKVLGANGVQSITGSSLNVGSMDFGACSAMHLDAGTGGIITVGASYSVSGNALGHLHVGSFGNISVPDSITITFSGSPAFSAYFIGVAQGTVAWGAPTISGSATGRRYLSHFGGVIVTPQSFSYSSIPGDSAGVANAGGIIVGSNSEAINYAPDVYTANTLEIQSIDFNTQTYVTRFKTQNDLFTSKGYFYCNGDGSYSSGKTYMASAAEVVLTSGTTDGATFAPLTNPILAVSNNNNPSLGLRRRGSDGDIQTFYRNTTQVGSISVTTTGTAYNLTSDYRLKDKIENLVGSGSFIDALKPRQWKWKVNGEDGAGFIAHELGAVSKSSVTGQKDAVDENGDPIYQAAFYSSSELIANMVAEIQDLRRRVAALEGK